MRIRVIGFIILISFLLASCAEPVATPSATRPPLPTRTPVPTLAPPTRVPPTVETIALIPTDTPRPTDPPTPLPTITPTVTPTPTITPVPTRSPTRVPSTVTPRPDIPTNLEPSLTVFRVTKASFLTAYNKVAPRMATTNNTAKLVLGQASVFTVERTIWTFFFTANNPARTWAAIYDSAGDKITILDYPSVMLLEDVGQWQPDKLLDSDEVATRLERGGLPGRLPFDTVFVQLRNQGRIPTYTMVNGALNKQLIVNGLNGEIIQNDFLP